jgi:hypothetical protein
MAERKKIGNEFSIHFAFGKSNFQISDRTLFFDFKNAWKILANRNAEAQSAEASKDEKLKFFTLLGRRDSDPRNDGAKGRCLTTWLLPNAGKNYLFVFKFSKFPLTSP